MTVSLILLLVATAAGSILTLLYDDEASPVWRLCSGAIIGTLLLGFAGFAAASWVQDITSAVLWLSGLAAAAPLALLARPDIRQAAWRAFRPAHPDTRDIINAILLVIVLGVSMRAAAYLRYDNPGTPVPSLYTGVTNNLGDLPLHVAIISSLAVGQNYPPQDPEFSGARLAYPFLVDFVAALLTQAGAPITEALLLQNVLLTIALAGLMHGLTLRLSGDRLAAALAPWLLFLSGGMGWTMLLGENVSLLKLPHDYTIHADAGYRWGNSLTTLLIPQRTLLLGVPLLIMIAGTWWCALRKPPGLSSRAMLASGVLAGCLPFAHTYFFLVLAGVGLGLTVLCPRRDWLICGMAAALVAAPQLLWLASGTSLRAGGFLAWSPGWDHGTENILWFWLKNTGLVLPLLALALYRAPADWLRFYLPFAACFAVPNLVRMAPWIWDNIKVLYVWFVMTVPLLAWVLAQSWRAGRAMRAAAIGALILLTLAGAIDVWRVATRAGEQKIFGAVEVAFASVLMRKLPPRSVTVHAAVFDSPVYLSGRLSLVGYDGHIWSRGLPDDGRMDVVARTYGADASVQEELRRLGVQYIIYGPHEEKRYPGRPWFERGVQPIAKIGRYQVYEVPRK